MLDRVIKIRKELDEAQKRLDDDPCNDDIRMEHSAWLLAFNSASIEEEHFLKQKAKVFWLREGDGNTKFFHKTIKGRQNRSRIQRVRNLNGEYVEDEQVANSFLEYYKIFL